MKIELNYPVFAFLKGDNMIYVFFDELSLKSINTQILKTLKYENICHVDSLGNKYRVDSAFKVKYLGLWGFNPLIKGRQILIDFNYKPTIDNILFEDFKLDIIDRIEKTKRIWLSGWSINKLKLEVKKCTSFQEIAYLIK